MLGNKLAHPSFQTIYIRMGSTISNLIPSIAYSLIQHSLQLYNICPIAHFVRQAYFGIYILDRIIGQDFPQSIFEQKRPNFFFGFQDEPLKWALSFQYSWGCFKFYIITLPLLGILHLKSGLHYSLSKRLKSYKSTFWVFEGRRDAQ